MKLSKVNPKTYDFNPQWAIVDTSDDSVVALFESKDEAESVREKRYFADQMQVVRVAELFDV